MARAAPVLALSLAPALLLHGCHDWDRFAGEPRDAGPPDAGRDGAAECTPRVPPPRGTAADGDSVEDTWFVLREIVLDQTGSWQQIGYDLDGLCSAAPEAVVECRPPNPSAALESDGEDGIDNAFGHWFLPAVAEINPAFEDEVRLQQAQGLGALLVRVRGWNGTADDPSVEVTITQSVAAAAPLADGGPPPLPDGGMPRPPRGDSSDWWWGREDTFHDGDPERPRALDDNAYVAGGVLVAHLPSRAPFVVSGHEASVAMQLTDAVFTMDTAAGPDGTLGAVLSGRWPLEDLRAAYRYIGVCPRSEREAAIEVVVALAADVREPAGSATPSTSPIAECNAISVGFELSGRPGKFAGLSSRFALTDLCTDAGAADAGSPDSGP